MYIVQTGPQMSLVTWRNLKVQSGNGVAEVNIERPVLLFVIKMREMKWELRSCS